MRFLGIAHVRFKRSVLEPQGQAILHSLKEQGKSDFENVRVGKIIEVVLEAADEKSAEAKMRELADQVLYNPVMEVCDIEIHPSEEG